MLITKAQIKALRKADTVCFDYYISTKDGQTISQIRAIQNERWQGPQQTKAKDELARIPAEYFLNMPMDDRNSKETNCYHYYGAAQMSKSLRTIFSLLREGDLLRLEWAKDAFTNEYQRKAGLHTDVLKLHVVRNGAHKYSFLVDTATTPDNTARMIRSKRWSPYDQD